MERSREEGPGKFEEQGVSAENPADGYERQGSPLLPIAYGEDTSEVPLETRSEILAFFPLSPVVRTPLLLLQRYPGHLEG